MAPDYLFLEPDRQLFDEKRLPNFQERLFQPLIGDLMPFGCPEITTFSNNTGRDFFENGLGVVREGGAGKGQGTPLSVMIQCSVGVMTGIPVPGIWGAREG